MSADVASRTFASAQDDTFAILHPQKVQSRPATARQASFPPIFAAFASMPAVETPRSAPAALPAASATGLSLFQHSKRVNLLDDLTTIFAGVPTAKTFVVRASLPVTRKAAEKKKRAISAPVASSFVHVQTSAHLASPARRAQPEPRPVSPPASDLSFYSFEPAVIDFRPHTPPRSSRDKSLPPSPELSPSRPAQRTCAVLKKPRTHSMEARAMAGWMSTLVDDYAENRVDDEVHLGRESSAWVTAAELEWRDALSSAEDSISQRSADRWGGNWV